MDNPREEEAAQNLSANAAKGTEKPTGSRLIRTVIWSSGVRKGINCMSLNPVMVPVGSPWPLSSFLHPHAGSTTFCILLPGKNQRTPGKRLRRCEEFHCCDTCASTSQKNCPPLQHSQLPSTPAQRAEAGTPLANPET